MTPLDEGFTDLLLSS